MIGGRLSFVRSAVAPVYLSPLGASGVARRGGGVGFLPSSISSLAHWYDATEITGSDGDAIGTWGDQEGSDDLTQSTSSKKPTLQTNEINDNQVVRGDGSDDNMTVDFADESEPVTIIFVARLSSPADTAGDDMMDSLTNRDAMVGSNGGSGDDEWRLSSDSSADSGTTVDANAHVFTVTWRASTNNDELRLDGTQIISSDLGTATLDGLTIMSNAGDSVHTAMDYGEVLYYNTELSTSDRNDVESYLSDKWGVTI